jgi:hypothetical protein
VAIWIGTAGVLVPEFRGLSEQAARDLAARTELFLRLLEEESDEAPPGTVLSQSPAPGATLPAGSKVAAVLARSATGEGRGEPPAPFRNLAAFVTFTVLYPAAPSPLELLPATDNPASRTNGAGEPGFEAVYHDPARPQVRLSLLEGNWFDPGLDSASTVALRGKEGILGSSGEDLALVWEEAGVQYGILARGLTAQELVSFATGLLPVPASGTDVSPAPTLE